MIQIKWTNLVNFDPTRPIRKIKHWPVVVNTGQTLVKGQSQGPHIKFGDKKEFGQLIASLEASDFKFHVLNLLLECY